MLKVVLVEDSADIRCALRELIASIDGVELVGSAGDSAGARRLIERRRPDVVVLDLEARAGDPGIDLLGQITARHPGIEVIALANFTWPAGRLRLQQAGATACFDKGLQVREACDWLRERAARP